MFKDFVYVLVEQEHQYLRTNTVLLCVSPDRADLEELVLSLWQECAYDIFCLHYMRGDYEASLAADYALKVADGYGKSLQIVRVPVWM